MKTINQLVKKLCQLEGLKSQTSVGNVRELVGHLSDILYQDLANINFLFDDPEGVVIKLLYFNGRKRASKKNAALQAKYDKYVAKKSGGK